MVILPQPAINKMPATQAENNADQPQYRLAAVHAGNSADQPQFIPVVK